MKTERRPIITSEILGRLNEFRDQAVEMGAQAGLHEVEDRFADVVEPRVRSAAWELHGAPGVPAAVHRERAEEMARRASDASGRVAAFFDSVRDASLAFSPARPMCGWRGCLIVMMTAALIGLLMHSAWRGVAVLALSAGIAVLGLPLLPNAVRFLFTAMRAAGACVRDMSVVVWANWVREKLEKAAWAADDHDALVDGWVRHQMGHLAAEYGYHKSLATTARLSQ